MNKIEEIIIEPNPIYKSSKFKIKVKCRRFLFIKELKSYTVNDLKKYKIILNHFHMIKLYF